jgi:hypothetical protein
MDPFVQSIFIAFAFGGAALFAAWAVSKFDRR